MSRVTRGWGFDLVSEWDGIEQKCGTHPKTWASGSQIRACADGEGSLTRNVPLGSKPLVRRCFPLSIVHTEYTHLSLMKRSSSLSSVAVASRRWEDGYM